MQSRLTFEKDEFFRSPKDRISDRSQRVIDFFGGRGWGVDRTN